MKCINTMTEEKKPESAPFDAELEIIKLQGRFRWVVTQLTELEQKDRSLSARISRLKLKGLEGEEEPEEEREEARRQFEELSLEEKAIKISELIDSLERMKVDGGDPP